MRNAAAAYAGWVRSLLHLLRWSAAALLLAAPWCLAQEFKPFAQPQVSVAQWQAYLDEVKGRHAATAEHHAAQQLVIYHDREGRTSYTFTLPGHPAHPAWITRRLQHSLEGMAVRHVGFYAGALEPFGAWFESLVKVSEEARRQLQPSLPPGQPS